MKDHKLLARLMFFVDTVPTVEADCWIWCGYVERGGYGRVGLRGKAVGAHRAMYEAQFGPIPPGMFICHTCDLRRCVNPAHLFMGTRQDNIADMVAKKRRRGVGGPRGEKAWKARLTSEQVLAIRSATRPYRETAAQFGITPSHARLILQRRIWKHI